MSSFDPTPNPLSGEERTLPPALPPCAAGAFCEPSDELLYLPGKLARSVGVR